MHAFFGVVTGSRNDPTQLRYTEEPLFSPSSRLKVNSMKVVVAERSVTLGTFSLPCVVPGLKALKTEHVKALCQNGVFLTGITTRTRQLCLKKKKKTR